MEKLPYPVLAQIMNCLEPKDLMLSFMPLNRSSARLLHMRVYTSNYLSLYFKSDSQFPGEVDLYQILKTLAKQPQARPISIFGFGTTGGMQGCNIMYWVDNLYKRISLKDYPAQHNKFNVNTVGVLASTQVKAKMIERIRQFNIDQYSGRTRYYHRGYLQRYARADSLRQSFLKEKGILALIGDTQAKKILKEKQKYEAWLECNHLQFEEIQRRKGDKYVLVDPINVEYADSGQNFFMVNELYFSRPLNYTRPVYAFMIFVSDIYVDVEDTVFDYFNDLKTLEEFELFMNTDFGKNLSISKSEDNENVIYRTFRPCNLDLKPVLWGLFRHRELEYVRVKLASYFRGVFLYTKLICPELRFNISNSNVDAKYVEVKGFEVNL